MTQSPDVLTSFSNAFADSVESAAASVVQVRGARVVASGLVYAPDTVATMASVVGREDGLHVRRGDGTTLDAELAGWDPTTGLAVLHVAGLGGTPIAPSTVVPRVGHLVLAVGRSWSNAVSASAGIVSVIGGPLPHGRRRAIEQVIRTTAPMHDGFAGGALIDTAGGLIGIATSLRIRDGRGHSRPRRVEGGLHDCRTWPRQARLPRHRRPTCTAAGHTARRKPRARSLDCRDRVGRPRR